MSKKNWGEDKEFRRDGFTTRLLHNCECSRMVLFNLAPGQVVEPHTANACVIMHVVEGSGRIQKGSEEISVSKDDLIFFEPNELHGIRAAADGSLNVLATVIPKA